MTLCPLLEGTDFVLPFRLNLHCALRVAATAVVLGMTCLSAQAQGKLDARYTASLAGIPIGKGAWVLDISEDQFTAAASGVTTGLLRVFAGGQGASTARGTMNAGQPVPGTYAATISADKKTDEVRMVINGGAVKEYVVDPPSPPNPERVPITEAHRRGVLDPMTASLIRVSGNGDSVGPEACQRSASIFDGRMRYDLQLAFKRMDKVKAEKGSQGPVAVCAIYFTPVAGFVPDRAAIKYLIAQRDMELWLAPIAGTRLVVPFRISIPTPIGVGVLEATQFVSAQTRAASAKTQ
jgi:hypothetical protein